MTDHYKVSLEILFKLLKEAAYDHWANWIQKDIDFWISQKKTDHHLAAYGGMGSINDISVGGSGLISVWKNKLFESTKLLSWSFAKGKITKAPLEEEFYRYGSKEISGWRCANCKHSGIDKINIELYLSTEFLPGLFVELIKQDKLIEILDLGKILSSDQIVNKRNAIEKLIQDKNIVLTNGNNWLSICPECQSKKMYAFHWNLEDNDTRLIESKSNLKMLIK